jgi:PadR family transcriptional regulator, regulatory protein PadR
MHSRLESRHDPQLLKGVLSLVLLRLLSERESYGYEVALRVRAAGLTEVPHGTIYPALSRLERQGWVESRLVPSRSGPARKYYRLTGAGRHSLLEREQAWRELAQTVDRLLAQAVCPEGVGSG